MPAAFSYVPRLVAPARLPAGFVAAAKACDAAAEAELGARLMGRYRRQLAAGKAVPGRVAPVSDRVGQGLFATAALEKWDLIGEYAGSLTVGWADGPFNPYLLRYPFESAYAIDARERGNETRFINHSSARPNVRRVFLFEGGLPRAVFVAAKAVAKGRQLLLDYGRRYRFDGAPETL